jgi:hypothetical protein
MAKGLALLLGMKPKGKESEGDMPMDEQEREGEGGEEKGYTPEFKTACGDVLRAIKDDDEEAFCAALYAALVAGDNDEE